ncbi:Indolepyruvate oxidoreductase subunit IorB II [Patulibacter medicamentivorans]|uniref:Indolepyruvate oxidoreductase subunit IorB II n=1 Tax=Patulibacter medicamentivorans TaxID=1097667 RepID=H0DZZ9_9ACTN|nr:indolepyruvate oxidoreductase subunit beta family protein [Patulibacter medicamentivorans]EHN12958.1 Indolepyruvate oxidoreductase subunit IorB II [Patulibacter medicamentivorans]
MSSWSEGRRPLTLAILALGGEGGGVLADWVVAVAEQGGWYAQNTSVAGVAQRTGATVYYVELFPPAEGDAATGGVRREPVMSIFPTPGEVDVVVASELMESGRAIQRGFSTADRTTLITSTSRVYSIDEKMAMGDGRVDDAELLAAAGRASKRLVAADFMQMAEDAGSVISASLFGAVAGCGALPFTREAFEAPIRAFGKGVESSLAAFAAGYDAATEPPAAPAPAPVELPMSSWSGASDAGPARPSRAVEARKGHREEERRRIAAEDPGSLVGPGLRPLAEQVRELPEAARSMTLHGLVRTAVYQDASYAERYLERVRRFAAVDPDREGEARLTCEAARHVALWMCFQDIIQVAQQKTRRARMDRIRQEAKAKPDQLLQVREYLHPQFDELTDSMPAGMAKRLRRSRIVRRTVQAATRQGMILNTTSILGYTQLSLLARMRPLRPRTLRFVREQEAIDRWIERALGVAPADGELAREIVECQRVLKGYGATYEHGSESFARLMDAADELAGQDGAAERLAALRDAALADEHGHELEAKLPKAPAH